MIHRIITENKNYEQTAQLVSEHFGGFTIITATNYRQGRPEHSLVIEICPDAKAGDGETRTQIDKLAYAIKKQNGQQAVMVQRIACQNDIV